MEFHIKNVVVWIFLLNLRLLTCERSHAMLPHQVLRIFRTFHAISQKKEKKKSTLAVKILNL